MQKQAAAQLGNSTAMLEMLAGASSHSQSAAAKPDVAARLAQLTDLHDRGVLTDAEFAAPRERILREI